MLQQWQRHPRFMLLVRYFSSGSRTYPHCRSPLPVLTEWSRDVMKAFLGTWVLMPKIPFRRLLARASDVLLIVVIS